MDDQSHISHSLNYLICTSSRHVLRKTVFRVPAVELPYVLRFQDLQGRSQS